MDRFHNCHIHTFTSHAVPDGFLPLGYMRVLRTRLGAAVTRFAASSWLGKLLGGPRTEKALAFADLGRLPTQQAILQHAQGSYPVGTRFVVLPMDFEFMGAGRSPQSYTAQLAELAALYLRPEYRDVIIPFVAVDARRPEVLSLVRKYVEGFGFRGIKMYPALGFWPFDERLDEVWDYAAAYDLPVLVHCSRGGVYGRQAITEAMRRHPRTGEIIKGGPKDFTDAYSDPDNYRPILEKHPSLRLCLAHWGGGSEWADYLSKPWPGPSEKSWLSKVNDLIEGYPNVYTDVAYTACNKDFYPLIKVLMNTPHIRERVLFGSDYYMVQMDATEREFSIGLRAYLGEEVFEQIAKRNPEQFVGSLQPA